MPRSSRHKSSKHSSKEAKEYSDSEKDLGLKDRKGKDESGGVRASKDSSEKRKLDSKDGKDFYGGSGNGDYAEDYSSSKRRKERVDDRASDRWNGGDEEYRGSGEGSKKSSKVSGDSKSKRRDGSIGVYEEAEEVKRSSSGGKGEGRHRDRDRDRDSSRKEGGGIERERDKEKERDRKAKEGRSERLVGSDEHRLVAKQLIEITDSNAQDELGSPEPDNQLERRMKKRRDGSIDGDKHRDDTVDDRDKRLSSRDDASKDAKLKDDKRKDDRYKEKHREDSDKDKRQRDGRRSDDKHSKDEKDIGEMQQKRPKLHDSDRDRDRHRDNVVRDRDRDRHHDRDHERDRGRDRDYDRDYDRDHDWELDRDGDRDHDRERNRDRVRDRDRDRDYDRDHDRTYDQEFDREYSTRYKDGSRGKKRSPDDRDDVGDFPSRGSNARYSDDVEKKSSSGDRIESDANKGRSQSRQIHVETIVTSNKRKISPSSSPHVGIDEYRHLNPEDLKYKDSIVEQRSKSVSTKDAVLERGSKYRSTEKLAKLDENQMGDLSNERSSSSKASPLGLVERSPSSSSLDKRHMNRSARRSLDIEVNDDRPSRDLTSDKPLIEESSPADSSFYSRNSQGNSSSLIPPHTGFRPGVDSPSFSGLLEDDGRDGRVNPSSRYRRSVDPNMTRGGHGNAWRGVPNWTPPPGFIPFQHGPHGGFQGMMPQFPGPLFGVRPSMEINHNGMPYHIPDADRFSGHLRPLGWQNMMDGSGPSHLHGWDGSNGVFRDEPHMYGASEWDQNRNLMNSRGRESSTDMWKGQNGDAKRDLLSPSQKEDFAAQASVDDSLVGEMSNREDNREHGVQEKVDETRCSVTSVEESAPKSIAAKILDSSKSSSNEVFLGSYYLSKLEISAEFAHPELFNQCMSLLDIEHSPISDEDETMRVIPKENLKAEVKSSNTLWKSSYFPAVKDSVFQRAMNLYKKERMQASGIPFKTSGAMDIISEPNQENVEEPVHYDTKQVEDPVPTSDTEIVDASISILNVEKAESVPVPPAAVEEKLEPVLTPDHNMENHNSPSSPMLDVPVQDYGQGQLGEPQPISGEVKLEVACSEKVKVEEMEMDADGLTSPDNASPTVTPLLTMSENLNGTSKANGDHSSINEAEGETGLVSVNEAEGETGLASVNEMVSGPLFVPSDGSPKACEAVINESESVNLSRIHHSPESTH